MEQGAAPAGCARLFGLGFENLTQSGLVDRIERAIRSGQRCWIATVNVNLLCLARRDPAFRGVLERADLRTADGAPIVLMSRLRGRPLAARVTGADLLLPLAERASQRGWRIFLCGAAPGVAERAAEELRRRAAGVQIVGTASPRFAGPAAVADPAANAALLAALRASGADVLLVAFGSPKQEEWIDHHRRSGALSVPVVVGVGASFDFVAGRQRRAPPFMRRVGLEWLYRMATQPSRLGPRYLRDAFTFLHMCCLELMGRPA